jgi:hypothetical protein
MLISISAFSKIPKKKILGRFAALRKWSTAYLRGNEGSENLQNTQHRYKILAVWEERCLDFGIRCCTISTRFL